MTKEQLAKWQTERGLSVHEFAALLGVHPVTVSRWRHGDRDIPVLLELALCELDRRLKAKKPKPKK